MKILAATVNYPPGSRVGAWLATHQHLRHLASRGHEVVVLSGGHRGLPFVHEGVLVESGSVGRPTTRPGWADVIVTHCGDDRVRSDLARSAAKPSVRFAHGGVNPDDLTADLVVWNSESLRSSRNGIVCHPPTVAAEHRVDQTGDRITLVNCSRDKGIMTAWGLADALPDRQFLGVRGGYGSQDHLPRTANWTTWPTQLDMRTVWAETRILLMPSAFETWGMAGVEAMCSGIPVIAHPTPGLRESLGDAGIFCDRDDIASWVAEVRRLDDPHEYEVASKAARARADELDPTPDLDRFADAVEALCS